MSKRVLIVEDNPDLGAVLTAFLALLSYESELTQSVKESIHLLQGASLFDVLVIDYTLEDGKGIEIINWCKERVDYKDLRFVLISGYDKSHFSSSIMEDPTITFLQKPFTMAKLKDSLG
jgi:DNA-binding NtrC family response regulator